MEFAHFPNDEFQHLQVWNRSVRLENLQALMRRWRLVQTGALDEVRCTGPLFPGQRDLLDFLAVATEAEILRIADCAIPLFGVNLRHAQRELGHFGEPPGALQLESGEESFLALAARQDAVRTNTVQARIAFGLTRAEAMWLSRFCPHELYALARDPAMVLRQAVHWDYFVAAAAGRLNRSQRTLFSAVCRNSPASEPG